MNANWQEYQATGFEPIDAEHLRISEGLVRLLSAVNTGKPKDALLTLESVLGQISSHFAHEEQLMVESGYPLAVRHKEAHDLYLLDAHRFLAELKKVGLSGAFRRWATGRALECFRFHIAANDVGLGRYLLAWELAGRVPAGTTGAMVTAAAAAMESDTPR
jgi:hemerythrin-like metal-binding protein